MAENKKSFILYADLIAEIIDGLPREIKGDLFQLIVDYVNDKDPQPTDMLLKTAFASIKLQLKRDLVKWHGIKEKRSLAGKVSAELRQQNSTKSTSVECVEQNSTNPTVSVNVNVNDNVSVSVIEEAHTPEKNISKFPDETCLEMVLPEIKIGAVIQLFAISKQINLIDSQVNQFWGVFKAQNFTGKKYYQSEKDIYSHFINWMKGQNIQTLQNGTHRDRQKIASAAVTDEIRSAMQIIGSG